MDNSANRIAKAALAVSILSFILALVTAVNQYRENVEVVIDDISVLSVNDNVISLEAEAVVANTSQFTVSLMESSVFLGGNVIDAEVIPEVPVSLISGYAEKVSVRFMCTFSTDKLSEWENGSSLDDVLNTEIISIRFKSAKRKMYSGSFKLENVYQGNIDLE
jgi:hypothetical protein